MMQALRATSSRQLLHVLLALVLAAGLAQPLRAQDAPAQPLAGASGASASTAKAADKAYSSIDLDWRDEQRQRAVPAKLYWPEPDAGKPAANGVPLVVFSHGIGGSRNGYSYLGSFWASHGVASLHVQHVGSDRGLWMGNPLGLVGRLQGAAREDEALNRVRDVSFALDQLLASDWGQQLDPARIVAAGHSYGANTSLLLSGARISREGQVLPLRDPRIKAAIIISAPPFYGQQDSEAILQGISVPTLHITASEDVIRIPGYFSAAEDRIKVFQATGGPDKALAVFQGGSHSIFTDRAGTGGVALNPRVKAATRELTLAFLHRIFAGERSELSQWPERYRDLLARWEPPRAAD
ncbi:hypothetical protein RQP53_18040 [Paucibacter sp. APW11]|uniref:Acetylhydrolase n=1 Tax=Roseateles aquae TaxID=3077235 RepID=A0ABU3PF82_9BURK|nr:hypothetical protein [Paucibacter sp. APW11]MDT9001184.1 hypothetical protein [Paucibacter sp. APW11]